MEKNEYLLSVLSVKSQIYVLIKLRKDVDPTFTGVIKQIDGYLEELHEEIKRLSKDKP